MLTDSCAGTATPFDVEEDDTIGAVSITTGDGSCNGKLTVCWACSGPVYELERLDNCVYDFWGAYCSGLIILVAVG